MRTSAVFKIIHSLTTITLLILVIGFLYLNLSRDRKASDIFESAQQVKPGLWLYATKNASGNATVPVVFRYYLLQKLPGSPEEVVSALHDKLPFIEGTGEIYKISADDNQVRVSYRGRVYSIEPSSWYKANGKTETVHIAYDIQ